MFAGAVQVHPHAEVEVRLRPGTDHRGQVQHHVRPAVDELVQHARRVEVGRDDLDPRVRRKPLGRHHVQHLEPLQWPVLAIHGETVPLQDGGHELLANEPGTAGDHDLHDRFPRMPASWRGIVQSEAGGVATPAFNQLRDIHLPDP
jgi:hypothetical protein